MQKHLLVSCVALVGCMDGMVLDETEAVRAELSAPSVPPDPEVQYESEQGRFILGRKADDYLNPSTARHFHVDPDPIDAAHSNVRVRVAGSTQGAYLIAEENGVPVYSTDEDAFDGMILEGVDGGQLKIESAVKPMGSGHTLYYLRYRPGTTGAFSEAYCGVNSDGTLIGAMPVYGYYTKTRFHMAADTVTFGCVGGTVVKCIEWGYVPGTTGPSPNVNTPNDWDYHQACTPMASADYCRTGEPSTRELTPILIRDFKTGGQPAPEGEGEGEDAIPPLEHPVQFPGDPDRYYIEAGWRARDEKPFCVSDERWAAFPLEPCGPNGGTGDRKLPDPRIDPAAKTCKEYTFAQLKAAGVLIINAAKMMDAPVATWERRSGLKVDRLTTIRGFYRPRTKITPAAYDHPESLPDPDARSVLPFNGAYPKFKGVEGMILRNLPGTLKQGSMIELFVWEKNGDRTVASASAAAARGFTSSIGFEGYSFSTPNQVNAPLLPLGLCVSNGDHDLQLGGACTASGFGMLPPPPGP